MMEGIDEQTGVLPPRTDPRRAVVSIKADDRFAEGTGEVKRASIGRDDEVAPIENGDETTKATTQCLLGGITTLLQHFFAQSGFAWGVGSDQHGVQVELFMESVVESDPRVGNPILFWIAGACDQGDSRGGEVTKEVGLPLQFWWPGPEIPLDRFAGNFQIVEKFKKVFLDVLDRSLREMVVVDEPVELASATGIESDFHRSTAERGKKGGFEVALQIEHHVEGAIGQLHGHFDKSGESRFSLKKQDFIHGGMPLD